MKTIVMYQTNDGCRFENFEEAVNYERLCNKCEKINNSFINIGRELKYNEYIQQDVVKIHELFKEFMEIVSNAIPEYSKMAQECSEGKRHNSHIQRIISDYNIKCLNNLMYRFECISFDNGKEFQQPYFTTHQDEVTNKIN